MPDTEEGIKYLLNELSDVKFERVTEFIGGDKLGHMGDGAFK